MGKYEETITKYTCDMCGEDEDYISFEFKGKYICGKCLEEILKQAKEEE